MSNLIAKAKALAMKAHAGMVRPNRARKPYITHPEEVAALIEMSGGSEAEIAAGWTHDVVEDTSVTREDIANELGEEVATIVDGLTDHDDLKGLPKLERKRLQAERVKTKSSSVKRAKLADQISNIRDIAIDPPVTWDHQKCLDYTNGAMLVAQACSGVSDYLDREFKLAYDRAIAAHS